MYVILYAVLAVWLCRHIVQAISIAVEKDLRRIPGPLVSRFTNIPLKLRALSGSRNSYIHILHQRYGPIVRVAPREIAVADIDAYRDIHRVGTRFTKAPWYQSMSPKQYDDETCAVFGVRDTTKAYARRKLFLQGGTPAALKEWEPRIVQIIDTAMDRIGRDLSTSGVADVMKWFSYMTTDILGTIAFGQDFGMIETESKPQIVKDIDTAVVMMGLKTELPWTWFLLETIPLPSFKRFAGLFDRFEEYADIAVQSTRQFAKGASKTLFSKMVSAEGDMLPERIIRQEAVNVIIAGSDTTAMTLTYLIYAVLADSTGVVRRKLLDESQGCPERPSFEDLRSLTYLSHVLDETLRLYGVAGASLPRVPPIEGFMLGGYQIPAGTVVMTQSSTFHIDPNVFSNAQKFDPGRWAQPSKEMRDHFMPFGGSARLCLGQNLARAEILYTAARLFKRFPGLGWYLLPARHGRP